MMEIAAFVGENGITADLFDKGRIVVYQKTRDSWAEAREMEFQLDHALGIKGMRLQMQDAISFLDQCRSFVARTVCGIAYLELDKKGFDTWESTGHPAEFLDSILRNQEEEVGSPGVGTPSRPYPVEVAPGRYRVSIKEIQESPQGYTSKQALQPFLRSQRFDRLEIECIHVPPWIEAEIASGAYGGEVNKGPAETIISLTRSGEKDF
ncbi:MAG: nitrogenase [Firmicutes bacterium]|nr:nitrogenase [Bacillota bacterium]